MQHFEPLDCDRWYFISVIWLRSWGNNGPPLFYWSDWVTFAKICAVDVVECKMLGNKLASKLHHHLKKRSDLIILLSNFRPIQMRTLNQTQITIRIWDKEKRNLNAVEVFTKNWIYRDLGLLNMIWVCWKDDNWNSQKFSLNLLKPG